MYLYSPTGHEWLLYQRFFNLPISCVDLGSARTGDKTVVKHAGLGIYGGSCTAWQVMSY